MKDSFKVCSARIARKFSIVNANADMTKDTSIFMQKLRVARDIFSRLLANPKACLPSSSATLPWLPRRVTSTAPSSPFSSCTIPIPFCARKVSTAESLSTFSYDEMGSDHRNELLDFKEDIFGGVVVNMEEEEAMEAKHFHSMLSASMSHWRQQGKKGVWMKLPIECSNLVEAAVKEGFRYHHAEEDYLMLVNWLPQTLPDMLPANASHKVGIAAFVMNPKREVLVVQESNGRFKGTGLWKLPTGSVNESEDISVAATREVEEETGIETEFVEVLGFRQRHQSFFRKSDMLFLCMLKPHSFDIQTQPSEIDAAQWMAVDEYAAQPFVRQNELFNTITKVCLAKLEGNYTGFTPLSTSSSLGKKTYFYFNNKGLY